MRSVPVILLAGGFGTRLSSVVPNRSKCLAPVASRPFLYYLLDQIAALPASRLLISVYFLSDQIRKEVGSRYRDIPIDYVEEPSPLGTGGATRLAMEALSEETFLVLNADSYLDIRLADFTASGPQAAEVNLAAVEMSSCSRFGRVVLDEAGRISGFMEKSESEGPGWINAGLDHFHRAALANWEPGKSFSLEKELFPVLARQGKLKGKRFQTRFIDIGTPESYQEAQQFFAGHAP
jgi:NDP-sugar pyrophosphorylase family protein